MKKSNFVKVLLLVLALALMAVLMVACSRDDEPDTPTVPDQPTVNNEVAGQDDAGDETNEPDEVDTGLAPLRLSIAAPYGLHDHDDHPIRREIMDRLEAYTNTEIDWMWIGDGYWDQLGLWILSDDVPSIMVIGHRDANFMQAVEEGGFWELTNYLDMFENLAYVHPVARENASINGRLFGIPRSRAVGRNGFGIRQDWLDNLGLNVPTTIDELYDVLWAFTNQDPNNTGLNDTFGLGVAMHAGPWDMMQMWFGVPNGWGVRDGELVPAHMTEEYDEALRWFRRLYSEGLVNPEFHELGNQYWDDLLRGVAGFTGDVVDRHRRNYEHMYNEMGMAGTWTLIPYVVGDHGPRTLPTAGFNNTLVVSAGRNGAQTHEDFLRTMQFLNDLNDTYVWNLIERGVEGVEWELRDGYWHAFTDDERTAMGTDHGNFRLGFNQIMPFYSSPAQYAGRIPAAPPHNAIRVLEAEIQPYIEQFAVVNYGASFVSPTQVEHGPTLNAMIADMRIDFIRGEIDDTMKHEIRQQWLRSGGQDIIDEVNALYRAAQ